MARPQQPLITRDLAIKSALEIIDEDGIDGLSLERLATKLGVKAPSLYYHFDGKADILNEVARLITFDVRVPAEPADGDWPEWFVEISTRFRRSVLRHPRAAPLLVQFFPRRFTLSTYERVAAMMTQSGVPRELHALIFQGLDKLTFGSALLTATALIQGNDELFPGLDPERDPELLKAVEANPYNDEALFQEAVRSFVRGAVQVTVKATSAVRP